MIPSLLLLVFQASFPVFTFSQFSLSVIPANQPVFIGQKVILTCQVKGFTSPLDYAVLFKRKDSGISEKCQTYQKTKYHLECEPNDWRRATTYKLHIKSVSWADRGEWFCIYAANLTKQNLIVYAPAELKRMSIMSLRPRTQSASGDTIRQQPPTSDSSAETGATATVVRPSQISSGSPPAQHVGLGTRTNPYDLRPGLALQLTCETSCGFPDANISWLIVNQTMSKPGLTTMGPNQIQSDQCNQNPSTREMTTTRSALNVDCSQLMLVGLNEIQCAVTGRQYTDHTPTRHVYVLCPDQYIERVIESNIVVDKFKRRGERQLHLTSGEVVGIAAGAAIALILVIIGCVVIRGSRKDSPLPINGHFLGQRV